MGNLSDNFFEYEFFGKNSGSHTKFDTWKARYIAQQILQIPRSRFDKKVKINSGKRGEAHNAKIGGSMTSDHMYFNETAAVDFKFLDGSDNKEMFLWMVEHYHSEQIFGQLIAYLDLAGKVRFIHVSKPSHKYIDDVKLARYMFEDNAGKQKYMVYQGKVVRP